MRHACGFMYLRQMETQAEERVLEAQKEKKLRDRSEQYSRQLEEELAAVKVYKTYLLASTKQCDLKKRSFNVISLCTKSVCAITINRNLKVSLY